MFLRSSLDLTFYGSESLFPREIDAVSSWCCLPNPCLSENCWRVNTSSLESSGLQVCLCQMNEKQHILGSDGSLSVPGILPSAYANQARCRQQESGRNGHFRHHTLGWAPHGTAWFVMELRMVSFQVLRQNFQVCEKGMLNWRAAA